MRGICVPSLGGIFRGNPESREDCKVEGKKSHLHRTSNTVKCLMCVEKIMVLILLQSLSTIAKC
jgi:hypothetical protein